MLLASLTLGALDLLGISQKNIFLRSRYPSCRNGCGIYLIEAMHWFGRLEVFFWHIFQLADSTRLPRSMRTLMRKPNYEYTFRHCPFCFVFLSTLQQPDPTNRKWGFQFCTLLGIASSFSVVLTCIVCYNDNLQSAGLRDKFVISITLGRSVFTRLCLFAPLAYRCWCFFRFRHPVCQTALTLCNQDSVFC